MAYLTTCLVSALILTSMGHSHQTSTAVKKFLFIYLFIFVKVRQRSWKGKGNIMVFEVHLKVLKLCWVNILQFISSTFLHTPGLSINHKTTQPPTPFYILSCCNSAAQLPFGFPPVTWSPPYMTSPLLTLPLYIHLLLFTVLLYLLSTPPFSSPVTRPPPGHKITPPND